MNWKRLADLYREFILPYPDMLPEEIAREIEEIYQDIKKRLEGNYLECPEKILKYSRKGEKYEFRAIHIPTATPGIWIVIADECNLLAIVSMDMNGDTTWTFNPPDKNIKPVIEEELRKLFKLGKYFEG